MHTHHFIALYERKKAIEGNVLRALPAYDNQIRLEKAINKEVEMVYGLIDKKTQPKFEQAADAI